MDAVGEEPNEGVDVDFLAIGGKGLLGPTPEMIGRIQMRTALGQKEQANAQLFAK